MATLLILGGIALLYYGGEVLVTGSMHLARRVGLSPMVIGLTVVAFATSSPELAATLAAVIEGAPDIAVGNVFGSNIANLAVILALAVVIAPFTVKGSFLKREVPFMLLATVLVYPMMLGGLLLNRYEGAFLVLLLVFYVYTLVRDPDETGATAAPAEPALGEPWPLWRSGLGVLLGVGILVGGAHALVSGATDLARFLGVPERVIGLTIVAFGTSLPELAASLVGVRRGEGDLVLGNLVGSNSFNLLAILGVTALVKPLSVAPRAMQLDYWVMLGTSVLLLAFLAFSSRLGRGHGGILLALYASYLVVLFR